MTITVSVSLLLSALCLAIWVYLLGFRGGFWRFSARLPGDVARDSAQTLTVTVLVPARNEAACLPTTLRALAAQDFNGQINIVVIDDHSDDGTKEAARAAGNDFPDNRKLDIIQARPLPRGWTGKLSALQTGFEYAADRFPTSDFIWLCDADIRCAPTTLTRLVSHARNHDLSLVSLMARLSLEGVWAKLLIPPFIYFFQKLYPFAWAARSDCRTAAAAGGCVLLRPAMLRQIGGFQALSKALIDDCSLARSIKQAGGKIWIGLADSVESTRPYRDLKDIWQMVARSAYAQLRYSPLLLLGSTIGMFLTYLLSPFMLASTLPSHWTLQEAVALLAVLAMITSYGPAIRYHRLPILWVITLPLAALFYMLMTLDSARRYWFGAGSSWKGRQYDLGSELING